MKSLSHHLLVGNSKLLTTSKADSYLFDAENKITMLITKVHFSLVFFMRQLTSQPSNTTPMLKKASFIVQSNSADTNRFFSKAQRI